MENQVEEVKSKIDIVSLISETVQLKKAGRNFKGLCPFHSEKTPSFMVNPERQIFKCFGCNEGGDSIAFVEKNERVAFLEALEILAKRAGVQLKKTAPNPADKQREILFKANQATAELFNFILTRHPSGKKASEYLKTRGVTASSIKEFGLGYAPAQEDTATKFLAKRGFGSRDLVVGGLILPSQRGKGFYDRFRDRITFPIRDTQGRVVGFSARSLGNLEPKYLNSPDSPIFNKSQSLFGIDLARSEITKDKQVVLVEGNLDVISSYQAGVRNVVCPLGTALTEAQVSLLRRFTDKIILALDTDTAGIAASKRAIELAENQGLEVKIAILGEYKDPDEMIKNDAKQWKKALSEATPVYDFIIEASVNRYSGTGAEGKRKATAEIVPYLNKIEDPILKEHYLDLAASRLGVKTEIFRGLLTAKTINSTGDTIKSEKSPSQSASSLEDYLLALLLTSESVEKKIDESLFLNGKNKDLFQIMNKEFNSKGKLQAKALIDKIPKALIEQLDQILLQDIDGSLSLGSDALRKEVTITVQRLRKRNLQRQLSGLNLMIKQAEAAKQMEKAKVLTNQFRDISLQLAGLDQEASV